MRLIQQNKTITISTVFYGFVGLLEGALARPGGTNVALHQLADETSLTYVTKAEFGYRIEDVGFLEVLNINPNFTFRYLGNGSIRWQISGDFGATWVTIGEGSFNVGVQTENTVKGSGLWITQITTRTNSLRLRFQVKSTTGSAVSTWLRDDSFLFVVYRKKVLF